MNAYTAKIERDTPDWISIPAAAHRHDVPVSAIRALGERGAVAATRDTSPDGFAVNRLALARWIADRITCEGLSIPLVPARDALRGYEGPNLPMKETNR